MLLGRSIAALIAVVTTSAVVSYLASFVFLHLFVSFVCCCLLCRCFAVAFFSLLSSASLTSIGFHHFPVVTGLVLSSAFFRRFYW